MQATPPQISSPHAARNRQISLPALMTEKTFAPLAFLPERYPQLSFPEPAWRWFQQACQDLEIALTPAHRLLLERLYSHLSGVNKWLNLTRLTDAEDYLKFHVFDSLTVLNLVQELSAPGDLILDLGSGGGYPGLPLLIWLPPDRRFVLLDSRPKKVAFLRQTLTLVPDRANAEAACFRGREVGAHRPDLRQNCDLVTARAVGKAAELLREASELLRAGGYLILLKGPNFITAESDEFNHACQKFNFELQDIHPIALAETDPDRYVVVSRRKNSRKKIVSRI